MLAQPASAVAVIVLLSSTFITCTHSLSTASSSTTASIRIGTRSSKLALTQALKFQSALHDSGRTKGSQILHTEIVHIDTTGDKTGKAATQQLPLAVSGVDFVGVLDEAVLNGEVDVAVHSLKDIPPACRWNVSGKDNNNLVIGAHLGPRATPLDVLITKDGSIDSIQTLPHGARVGSASIRRQAQLKANRSDLNIINIRGNIDKRLKALENGEIDALILAMAGLERLGIADDESSIKHEPGSGGGENRPYYYHSIPIETMLPGCGQGVIAITCRSDNTEILSLLKEVDDHEARIAATTERAFLDTVQILSPWVGRPPVAGFMRPSETSTWLFSGLLATPDGAKVLRVQHSLEANCCNVETAQALGRMAGEEVVKMAGDGFLDGYY